MQLTPYLFLFLSSLTLCYLLVPTCSSLAHRFGLRDQPGHRKIHTTAVPKCGGLVIVLAVILSLTAGLSLFGDSLGFDETRTAKTIFILGMVLAALLIGLWDDLKELKPRHKFLLQALLAGAFSLFGFRFDILHIPGMRPVELAFFNIPFTMFWIMALLNGFNFMDGVDGLAGSVSAVCLIGLGGASLLSTGHIPGVAWVAFLGAIISFLFYNWKPAKIYLGDSGAMALGMFITAALLSIGTVQPDFYDLNLFNTQTTEEPYRFQFLTATLLVGYPAFEVALSTMRRFVKRFHLGRSMESSEQEHIHHRLLKAGWTPTQICLSAIVLQSILTGAGLLVMDKQNALATWLLFPLFLVMAYLTPRLGFFDFLQNALSDTKSHFLIANNFITMQRAKLNLAHSREEVLALVSQTCREFGVSCFRLKVRPDEDGKGGMDYISPTQVPKIETNVLPITGPITHPPGELGRFYDYCEMPGRRDEAFWVFESHTTNDELDVEYRILMHLFMRDALETSVHLGIGQDSLDLPSVAALPHAKTSGHHLRKRHPKRAH